MESMPAACDPKSGSGYKNGHDPIIFYTDISAAECQAGDVGVSSLTAQSGALWNDLQNQTLPSFSWVTPDESDNDEGSGTPAQNEQASDTWLQTSSPRCSSRTVTRRAAPSYWLHTTRAAVLT
jgi:phospholipase C